MATVNRTVSLITCILITVSFIGYTFTESSCRGNLRSEQDLVVAWLVGEQGNVCVKLALGIAA